MKHGYSMFTGELVDAKDIDYGECKNRLVVCPLCKEAVFKSVRERGGETSHFLSHYSRTEESHKCDLRVSKMTQNELRIHSTQYRGQSFDEFMTNINSILIEAFSTPGLSSAILDEDVKQVLRNPNFNLWFRMNASVFDWNRSQVYDLDDGNYMLRIYSGYIHGTVMTHLNYTLPRDENDIFVYVSNDYVETGRRFLDDVTEHWRKHHKKMDWKFLYAFVMAILWKRYPDFCSKQEFHSKMHETQDYYLEYFPDYVNKESFVGTAIGHMEMAQECANNIFNMSKLKFESWLKKNCGATDFADRPPFALHLMTLLLAHGFVYMLAHLPNGRKYFIKSDHQ